MVRFLLAFSMLVAVAPVAHACKGLLDPTCGLGNIGKTVEKSFQDLGKAVSRSQGSLIPVRQYLKAADIPPPGVGAYGLVVFRSKPTDATRARYAMVCQSFVAAFPRSETSNVPIKDQMITVWPIDNPDAEGAIKDDCSFILQHYDLNASGTAIRDAHVQHAELDGEGPYLIGWSPSDARADPDKLVLIVDLSDDNSQSSVDHKFLFWKNKIVQNPELWKSGFSLNGVRLAIHDFAEQYGQSMLDAIKLVGGKK